MYVLNFTTEADDEFLYWQHTGITMINNLYSSPNSSPILYFMS